MKGKIFAIMICAVMALGIGTTVAYYNTKSFGFDEDAKIITRDDEKISFLDFELYYKDIDAFMSKARQYIPDEIRAVHFRTHYNVYNI